MSLMGRDDLEAIWRAGVAACQPARVVPPHLPEPPRGRTILLALGKAAVPMTRAVEAHWRGPLEGLAVAPRGAATPLGRIQAVAAGHPLPDRASVTAAERLLRLAEGAGADDLVLLLLSGGASALACLPGEGLGLDAKRQLTDRLLRSGAGISEINVVRRHLSRFKGGRLALAAAPARLVTLAISDTFLDRPEDIGSGPTAGDPTGIDDALAILTEHGIAAPETGWSETPKSVLGDYRIVARGRDALHAAAAEAERRGYRPRAFECEGEARRVGAEHARLARALGPGEALISGGELTVTVTGAGRGGPNQEYALAAAIGLKGARGLAGLAGDTDGIDGNGDAAGAFFDGRTAGRGAEAALAANDSGAFLDRRGALFRPGPTGTNVNDLRIVLRTP
ncbi:MAG: glycerate kinase [Allosphingosinicella sp.]